MNLLKDGGITVAVNGVEIILNKKTWGHFWCAYEWNQIYQGCKPSTTFIQLATKSSEAKQDGVPKKYLKGEFQLTIEFVNKVMVPRSEKHTVASAANLFLM